MNDVIVYVREEAKTVQTKPDGTKFLPKIPRGVIRLRRHDSDTFRVGWSICSRKDQFNKKLGRTISDGRANNAYQLFSTNSKTVVKDIFDAIAVPNKVNTDDIVRAIDLAVRIFQEKSNKTLSSSV